MSNQDITKTIDNAQLQVPVTEARKAPDKVDMAYILERIDRIMEDTGYLHEALDAVKNLSTTGPGDIAGQAKGEAIAAAIKCRETTNQRLIGLFEKMYEDIKPGKPAPEIAKFQMMLEAIDKYPHVQNIDIIKKAAQQMFVQPGSEIV